MTRFDAIIAGVGVLVSGYSIIAYRNPTLALRGRRGRNWVKIIGEEKTIKLGRYVGVPLTALMGIFLLFMGLTGKAHELNEKHNQPAAAETPP